MLVVQQTLKDLWCSLGVGADPGIQDFAMVTRDVAANMEDRTPMEHELQVLETCLSGVHDCVAWPAIGTDMQTQAAASDPTVQHH